MGNPYVISAELDLVTANLGGVVEQGRVEGFRESLDADLRSMGKETVWVSSADIQCGMEQAIEKTSLPVVSLDDRYISSADQYIGVSRGVRSTGDPYDFASWPAPFVDAGYVPRVGYGSIKEQLSKVASLGSEIVLADDVVFSGEMVTWLAEELKTYGVKLGAVICGIAIKDGAKKIAAAGIDVDASKIFEQVEDEICERDFALVPGSGRRADRADINDFYADGANVLYFDDTYGDPEAWASINSEDSEPFCLNSIVRSRNLLRAKVPISSLGCFIGFSRMKGTVEEELGGVIERGVRNR